MESQTTTQSPQVEYLKEIILKRELRNIYFSTLKSVRDYTMKFISSSIYISPDQPAEGYEVKASDPECADMLSFRRFMDAWEKDFSGPLFEDFLQQFLQNLSAMLEDQEFIQ